MKLIGKWQRDVLRVSYFFLASFVRHKITVHMEWVWFNAVNRRIQFQCSTIDRDGLFDVFLWAVVSLFAFFLSSLSQSLRRCCCLPNGWYCVHYLHFGWHGSRSLSSWCANERAHAHESDTEDEQIAHVFIWVFWCHENSFLPQTKTKC